jgi:hypothetical protein
VRERIHGVEDFATLVITDQQIDRFVAAVEDTLHLKDTSGGFWSEALGIVQRAVRSI